MEQNIKSFKNTFSYKLIYIFSIHDDDHADCVKVGDTTLDTDLTPDRLFPNCRELNQAAMERIRQYTRTAGITVMLKHTELAIRTIQNKDGSWKTESFRDHDVHRVLSNSGYKKKSFGTEKLGIEWFVCDDVTAIKAITAVKHDEKVIDTLIPMDKFIPISFRPEQEEAISKTVRQFKKSPRMLWNAKMRFGKTLSALEVVRRCQFKKTVLITHRPVVDDGWQEDFGKIFTKEDKYRYGSKKSGIEIQDLEKSFKKENKNYIYFASIQDLRGSKIVGGKFAKNDDVFNIEWDCVIIDEAHEGTTTDLGDTVKSVLFKPERGCKLLELSGTPFNILSNYEDDEDSVFTWDYVMEQKAKKDWEETHFGDSNPYSDLPEMKMYTYDLGKLLNTEFIDIEDKAFNFKEFFRTDDNGNFVHKNDVKNFLDLLCKKDENSLYPFSNQQYIDLFRHSLWMIPGVKEALALQHLLEEHPVFCNFNIINVAGDGDPDDPTGEALEAVRSAIKEAGADGYTITLSCGKLTTGVSVKQWTAVFMLYGTYSTKAAGYLQTIFRVQTPCNDYGKVKTCAYVFDFAPDRTLKMVSDAVSLSAKAGKTTLDAKIALGEFLNFCPVIGIDGSLMKNFEVAGLLQQLKRVYAERAVAKGFDDNSLYNDELLKLTAIEIQQFNNLKSIVQKTNNSEKMKDIPVNAQGLTEEEYKKLEKEKHQPEDRIIDPEEEERRKKLAEMKKHRQTAISILRSVSTRMPLLIYGADVSIEEDITLKKFIELVDDSSWEEFMPKGVSKEIFNQFLKYYDEDVFIAAGKRIRNLVKQADDLPITGRINKIAEIFGYFRNPDKETVLTPWRVVNMHMGDCLGGYSFFDSDYAECISEDEEPHFVYIEKVTDKTLGNPDAHILEINSKTGLYPLYCTYSIFRAKKQKNPETDDLILWDKTLEENIFVICKTPMAKKITKRTLCGYREIKSHCHYFDVLVNQLKEKTEQFINKVTNESYWGKGNRKMEFDAIVGNPPYQDKGGSGGNNDAPIYQHFVNVSIKIMEKQKNKGFISMITPSRWFAAGRENLLGDFRKKMLSCGKIKTMFNYANGTDIFTNVEVKGGICYFLYDEEYRGNCLYMFKNGNEIVIKEIKLDTFDILIRDPKLQPIVQKVETKRIDDDASTVDTIISADTPFGIPSNPRKSSKNSFKVYTDQNDGHDTLLYHIENNKRKIEFCFRNDIHKNTQDIGKYKVFIPGAGGSGNDSFVLGKPEFAPENSVCSQSYLYIPFDYENEAVNFIKYLKSKFFRVLVSARKITQSAPNRVYKFVPLQDFTSASDIDWTQSIPDIDKQLYKKYNLSPEEIAFIESKIKAME